MENLALRPRGGGKQFRDEHGEDLARVGEERGRWRMPSCSRQPLRRARSLSATLGRGPMAHSNVPRPSRPVAALARAASPEYELELLRGSKRGGLLYEGQCDVSATTWRHPDGGIRDYLLRHYRCSGGHQLCADVAVAANCGLQIGGRSRRQKQNTFDTGRKHLWIW